MLINGQYFKEMTIGQKIKYLLYYYGVKLIVAAVIIVFAINLMLPFLKRKNYNAYCLVFNDVANFVLVEHIEKTFPEYLNDNKYFIKVDNGFGFVYVEEHGINWPEDNTQYKILTLSMRNDADVIIADYNTMLWAIQAEFIIPIESILPPELLEELRPYFVYAHFNGTQFRGQNESDGKVYGLDISQTEMYKGRSLNYINAILLIPTVTSQPEMGIDFIKYCFGL